MSQDEANGVGLRERQHGDVHLHGGAVGGVDVESALWTHDEQLVHFHTNMSSNKLRLRETVSASHFFGPVGGRLRVTEAVLRLLQPLPFGSLVKSNHRLYCPVCKEGSKEVAESVYLVHFSSTLAAWTVHTIILTFQPPDIANYLNQCDIFLLSQCLVFLHVVAFGE